MPYRKFAKPSHLQLLHAKQLPLELTSLAKPERSSKAAMNARPQVWKSCIACQNTLAVALYRLR